MAIVHERVASAIPETGFAVQLTWFGSSALIVLFKDREITWQATKSAYGDALFDGLGLAAVYDCALVEHHPNVAFGEIATIRIPAERILEGKRRHNLDGLIKQAADREGEQ